MARGQRFPLRITAHGGLELTSATDPGASLRQVIAVALYPGRHRNPFEAQPLSGGVYRTPASDGALRAEIRRVFTELEAEGRAMLRGQITLVGPDDRGRRALSFEWRDLETGRTQTWQVEV